jgi:hypothetical protein
MALRRGAAAAATSAGGWRQYLLAHNVSRDMNAASQMWQRATGEESAWWAATVALLRGGAGGQADQHLRLLAACVAGMKETREQRETAWR